jgi:hypothetical protein
MKYALLTIAIVAGFLVSANSNLFANPSDSDESKKIVASNTKTKKTPYIQKKQKLSPQESKSAKKCKCSCGY